MFQRVLPIHLIRHLCCRMYHLAALHSITDARTDNSISVSHSLVPLPKWSGKIFHSRFSCATVTNICLNSWSLMFSHCEMCQKCRCQNHPSIFICSSSKYNKTRFRPGLRPWPGWDTPLDPLNGWAPSPYPLSQSLILPLSCQAPQVPNTNSGLCPK